MIRKVTRKNGTTAYDARRGSHGAQRRFASLKAAREYIAAETTAQTRSNAGLPVAKGNITFRELFDLWAANNAPSAWRRNMLRRPLERWGKVRVRDVQPEAFGAWLHELPLAGKTKSHILESTRKVFNAGVEWGYLAQSPVRPRAFKAPSTRRKREIRPLSSWSEVLLVAAECGPIMGPFVRFCCATGLRVPGEVIDLTWSQIDLRERTVRVDGTKTDAAQRAVPLSTEATRALAELPMVFGGRGGPSQRRVFFGKTGGRLDYSDWRKTDWPLALAAAGLEHRTPYEMRHTFATLALEAGALIEDVSTAMGHKDIKITLDYYRKWTRPMVDRLRGFLDTIGDTDAAQSAQGS